MPYRLEGGHDNVTRLTPPYRPPGALAPTRRDFSKRAVGKMTAMNSRDLFGRLFIPVSLAEGVSFLILLFVAVPLQIAGHPALIPIMGMVHGLLFVAYVMIAAWGHTQRKWTGKRLAWVLVMAVLPTGAFFAERSVKNEVVAPVEEPVAV